MRYVLLSLFSIPGVGLNIKMPSCHYRDPHDKDKKGPERPYLYWVSNSQFMWCAEYGVIQQCLFQCWWSFRILFRTRDKWKFEFVFFTYILFVICFWNFISLYIHANRRQAIIWTNSDLVYWCIYKSLVLNELRTKFPVTSPRAHWHSPYSQWRILSWNITRYLSVADGLDTGGLSVRGSIAL